MNHYKPGNEIQLELETLRGESIRIPSVGKTVHLQFRRYAGCPICNLHLRGFVQRHSAIEAAGIVEVVIFHSTKEDMLSFQGDLPFHAVADPGMELYRQFGVGASVLSILHPGAYWPFLKSVFTRTRYGMFAGDEGGHGGFPADFLIDSDGVIRHCKYGKHAADHWEVDELLRLAEGLEHPSTDQRNGDPSGVVGSDVAGSGGGR